mgnify:CR=1 FL=1
MDQPEPLLVRDRASGQLVPERVFGGGALRFLYGTPQGLLLTRLLAARRPFSVLYGLAQRGRLSRRRVGAFAEALGIDASEAEKPLGEYRSLDEFFARRLRAGARPIDPHPDHLVSPADGRALAWQALPARLTIKDSQVGLRELVGEAALADELAGGPALLVRLAPADYHRFHFPAAGVAGRPRVLPGGLHSVHPIALAAGAPSLLNRRAVTRLESDRFGPLLLIEVGAMIVGTIEHTYFPGRVEKGAEKGTFHFGGSTVLVLARAGRVVWDEDLLASTAEGLETLVRMGTRVGRRGEAG